MIIIRSVALMPMVIINLDSTAISINPVASSYRLTSNGVPLAVAAHDLGVCLVAHSSWLGLSDDSGRLALGHNPWLSPDDSWLVGARMAHTSHSRVFHWVLVLLMADAHWLVMANTHWLAVDDFSNRAAVVDLMVVVDLRWYVH